MEAPKINKKVIIKESDTFAHSFLREIFIALSCLMNNNAALSGVLLFLALCRRLSCSTRVVIANIIGLSIGLHFKNQFIKNNESSNSTGVHSHFLAK